MDLETEIIELMLGIEYFEWSDSYRLPNSLSFPTIEGICYKFKGKYRAKDIRQTMANLVHDGLVTSYMQPLSTYKLTVYIPTKALEMLR